MCIVYMSILPSYKPAYYSLTYNSINIPLDVVGDLNPYNFTADLTTIYTSNALSIDNNTGTISGGSNAYALVDPHVVVSFDSDTGPHTIDTYIYINGINYLGYTFYQLGVEFTLVPSIELQQFSNFTYSINTSLYSDYFEVTDFNETTGTISLIGTDISPFFTKNVSLNVTGETLTFNVLIYFIGVNVTYEDTYNATTGQVFSALPNLNGGASPDAYTVVGDPLPPGLSLNTSTGEIYGTPTGSASNNTVTIRYTVGGSPQYTTNVDINVFIGDCLCGDASILTPDGYKTISNLKDNDYVITDTNIRRQIKKVRSMDYYGSIYCMKRNFISENIPIKDIYMSANHKYYKNGRVYRPSKYLEKIEVSNQKNPIKVYHVQLENETENIVVDGLVMESYHEKKDSKVDDGKILESYEKKEENKEVEQIMQLKPKRRLVLKSSIKSYKTC